MHLLLRIFVRVTRMDSMVLGCIRRCIRIDGFVVFRWWCTHFAHASARIVLIVGHLTAGRPIPLRDSDIERVYKRSFTAHVVAMTCPH